MYIGLKQSGNHALLLLLSLYTAGALRCGSVEVVTVRNCYIYYICFVDGFFKYNYYYYYYYSKFQFVKLNA